MESMYTIAIIAGVLIAPYLLYRFLGSMVNFTIRKLKMMEPPPTTTPATPEPIPAATTLDKFPVKIGDKVIFIDTTAVAYLAAKDNYVYIHDLDGNEYLTDYTLKALEEKTEPDFVRIHRSYLIRKGAIGEIHKYLNGKYAFILRDTPKSKLISSLSYTAQVKALFKI